MFTRLGSLMACKHGPRTAALPRNVNFADAAAVLDDGQSRRWHKGRLPLVAQSLIVYPYRFSQWRRI